MTIILKKIKIAKETIINNCETDKDKVLFFYIKFGEERNKGQNIKNAML